ncbi:hypothetical protein JCM11251_006605 [Rhodosporidiobolus azoricus]
MPGYTPFYAPHIPGPPPQPPSIPPEQAVEASSQPPQRQPSPPLLSSPGTAPTASISDSQSPAPPPTASTSKKPYVPPPPPPPLGDPFALLARSREGLAQLVAHGNIDARPSRQGPAPPPKSGACSLCRTAKAKCSQDEPRCTRCVQQNLECTYPIFNKRGRKRMLTPNQVLICNIHRDVETALEILAHSSASTNSPHPAIQALRTSEPSTSSSASTMDTSEEDDESRRLKSVIESPLAVLAHISSLKVTESTEEESGKTFLPKEKGEKAGPAEGYFATGLYQLRSDADAAFDPVNSGLLTAPEFDRLVDIYFAHLHPFFLHLAPALHTPRFLRDVSPFLSTALAYICASFEPEMHHLVPALNAHVQRLSDRVWSEGLKSLEIVQAYLLLIHWTPIENDWGDDRRWAWLAQAIRIATEIKLHKTINNATYDFYRSVTPLGEGAYAALKEMRAWSWKLVFVTDIALCVSTGRTGSVQAFAASKLGSPLPARLPPDHPEYNITALIYLNRLYAKAIIHSNNLQDSETGHEPELRQTFKDEWQRDLQAWLQDWPHISPLVRLIAQHDTTILLSISLRFKGPVAPVLEDCRLSALETAKMAVNIGGDLRWSSNLIVVMVAYAATLLLRITAAKGPIDEETKMLCAAVADGLICIGEARSASRTLATLHGTRIHALLSADLPKHAAAAVAAAVPAGAADPCLISPASSTAPLPPPISTTIASSDTLPENHMPAQVILDAQAQNLSYPAMPSLFDLPTTDSHLLWDLFNDQGAPANPGPQEAGTSRQPDAWVWKTANDQQDWLSSEPGAWAW